MVPRPCRWFLLLVWPRRLPAGSWRGFSLSAVLAIAAASVGAHAVRNSYGLYELQLA